MKNYIGWSCEYHQNTGEGKLARKFLGSAKREINNYQLDIIE